MTTTPISMEDLAGTIDTAKAYKNNTINEIRSELNKPNIAGHVTGVGLEIGTGYAMDVATAPLLGFGPLGWAGYGAANFTSGALSNWAAQRLRGEEEISWGEIIQSGLLDIVPFFGQKLKGAKGVANIALQSGARTVVGRQGEEAIDEQRWLTPRETLESALVGGAFGTMFKGVGQGHAYWKANHRKYHLEEARELFQNPAIVQELIKQGRIRYNGKSVPKDFIHYHASIKNELGGGKRRPTDWSDISPSGRPADVDADQLGKSVYATQWEGISNEIDYDFSKVSTKKTTPRIKSTNGNTVPEWVGTPIVRNAEQFLKDNPGKNLDSFPLTKWDDDYWVPKIRTRSKIVNGKKVKQSYIGLDKWSNRKKFDVINKASRKRRTIEQSEGVAPGTLAKEKVKQLNAFNKKRRAVGRRPLSMSEVQMDHVTALKAYDMYTDGLPKYLKDEFKALLAKENLTTGDNIGNLKLRETKIHSRLWPALRARLKLLGHKYKSYDFASPQERMKYYKEINLKSGTGETRIAEFAEAIHKIDEEGTDLMNDLLKPIPKGKKTVRVKKSTKDLLIEMLGGGDLEEGEAAYRKLMADLKDIPANVKEEFIMDAIYNADR